MIVHKVSPQIPDVMGDVSTTFNMMFIMTRTSTTNIPNLPGNASGGTRKLNQLTKTIMQVGR